MGAEYIVTLLIGVAAVVGGYVGGRKNSTLAKETIEILGARLDLVQKEAEKIPTLLSRIKMLEDLVTQRADVETVKAIVTRIEEKLDERS